MRKKRLLSVSLLALAMALFWAPPSEGIQTLCFICQVVWIPGVPDPGPCGTCLAGTGYATGCIEWRSCSSGCIEINWGDCEP